MTFEHKHHRVSSVSAEGVPHSTDFADRDKANAMYAELTGPDLPPAEFVGRYAYADGRWFLLESTQESVQKDLAHLRSVTTRAVELWETLAGELK